MLKWFWFKYTNILNKTSLIKVLHYKSFTQESSVKITAKNIKSRIVLITVYREVIIKISVIVSFKTGIEVSTYEVIDRVFNGAKSNYHNEWNDSCEWRKRRDIRYELLLFEAKQSQVTIPMLSQTNETRTTQQRVLVATVLIKPNSNKSLTATSISNSESDIRNLFTVEKCFMK